MVQKLKKANKFSGLILASALVASIFTGCAKNESATTSSPTPAPTSGTSTVTATPAPDKYTGGPVELLVQDRNTGLTEEEFDEYFAKPVKAKYPDITLKLTKETNLDKLLAGGTPPDLVAVSNARLREYMDVDYPEELDPTIKKYNIDLNAIEPSIVEVLKGIGKGKIYGLPFGMNYGAMIYNKDLFDKFNVPYPKDVITWDEYLDISKRLTRQDGGTQYIGGSPNSVKTLLKQFGAPIADPKDEKIVLTTDKHKDAYSLLQKFYDIPGFIQGNNINPTAIYEGKTAMQVNWVAGIAIDTTKNKPAFNWDIAAFPVVKERPTIGAPVDFHMLAVNKAGKNKEAAYRVLMTMLDPKFQEELTKNGRITPLKDPKIKEMFAQKSKAFEGKNLKGVFKVAPAVLPDYSQWEGIAGTYIDNVAKEMGLNKKDMNTASREQEEAGNKAVNDAKAAKK